MNFSALSFRCHLKVTQESGEQGGLTCYENSGVSVRPTHFAQFAVLHGLWTKSDKARCNAGMRKCAQPEEAEKEHQDVSINMALTFARGLISTRRGCRTHSSLARSAAAQILLPLRLALLKHCSRFMVDREETGADGVLYLKLADGRGWVFDQKPNWGVICAPCSERKAAVPPVAAPKKEKAKPKPKAKEKAERPCSECSERSRSQKRVETSKQRRSSSSQRRSANDEDLASPTSTARGRSPTRRVRREPSRNQKKNQDTATKPRETAMEACILSFETTELGRFSMTCR
eukprot:symbB.v1.2.030746.t1/scaffold3499.1/size55309/5